MNYKIYKFEFTTGVHFGKKSLEDAEYTIGADTIFSAMCQEMAKQKEEVLQKFVDRASNGEIIFSDLFPYIKDTYYIPKPMLKINTEQTSGDSTIKKAYKKLSYIPIEQISNYLNGNMDVKREVNKFTNSLGKSIVKVNAAVRMKEETLPYRVGTYYFNYGNGLYFIVGYNKESDIADMEYCLQALQLTGIGGKRSSGLGRFTLKTAKVPKELEQRLDAAEGKVQMTLSVCLPKEDELEKAIEGAGYLLIKRSGFVASDTYAQEQVKKKDLYLMQAGACFKHIFEGDIYDVGENGNHSVYRYAKPMFMEVMS